MWGGVQVQRLKVERQAKAAALAAALTTEHVAEQQTLARSTCPPLLGI